LLGVQRACKERRAIGMADDRCNQGKSNQKRDCRDRHDPQRGRQRTRARDG
jgi:hypothetical protein